MLVQWCTYYGLAIFNTFANNGANQWTYSNGGRHYQLGYIFLDKSLYARNGTCEVLQAVDIGSNHRPILLGICMNTTPAARSFTKHTQECFQVDRSRYAAEVEHKLKLYPWDAQSPSRKAACLDGALVQAKADAEVDSPNKTIVNATDG